MAMLWIIRCIFLISWMLHFKICSSTGRQLLLGGKLKLNQTEAEKHCSPSERLPLPSSDTEQRVLEHLMLEAGYQSIWLAGRRHRLDKWIWVNGEEYGEVRGNKKHNCGVFGQDNNAIISAQCSDGYPGHICEVPYCSSCKDVGRMRLVCRQFGNKCYIFYCDHVNWYNARASCIKNNWDLSTIPNRAMSTWLSSQDFNCKHFFIGLSREAWQTEDTRKSLYTEWAIHEPSAGDCMLMKRFEGDIRWASTNCTDQTNFICIPRQGIKFPSLGQQHSNGTGTYTAAATEKTATQENHVLFPSVIVVLVVVVLLGAATVVVLYWKRNRSMTCRRRGEGPSATALLGNEGDLRMLLAGKSEKYCRVNLSSGDMKLKQIKDIYTDTIWSDHADRVKKKSDYSSIFDQALEDIPRVTLLCGENGVGKSAFVKKILNDWVEHIEKETKSASCLSEFQFVIYLMLSKVKEERSINQIMANILNLEEDQATKILNSVDRSPGKNLLIFDGYNELTEEIEDFKNILNGKKYNRLKVLITCRMPWEKYIKIDPYDIIKTFKIKGFSEEQVKEYISKYPLSEPKRRLLLDRIETESWGPLAVYPHVLRFLCSLHRHSKKILSRSIVYGEFLSYSRARCHRKYPSFSESNTEAFLREIGEVAVNGIRSNAKYTFSRDEIHLLSQEARALGVFIYKGTNDVCFLNEELQDFLCAYYLERTTAGERKAILNSLDSLSDETTTVGNILQFTAELVKNNKALTCEIEKELVQLPRIKERFRR